MISPDRRRAAVKQVMGALRVSERRACRVIGQPRATQRYPKRMAEDEEVLRAQIVSLASRYGRYGYRRVTAMLRNEGRSVNHKRVERIWRQEGQKVPAKQPKRSRLWLNDGSIVRLRPEFAKGDIESKSGAHCVVMAAVIHVFSDIPADRVAAISFQSRRFVYSIFVEGSSRRGSPGEIMISRASCA